MSYLNYRNSNKDCVHLNFIRPILCLSIMSCSFSIMANEQYLYNKVNVPENFTNNEYFESNGNSLDFIDKVITRHANTHIEAKNNISIDQKTIDEYSLYPRNSPNFYQAISIALQRNPLISEAVLGIRRQNESIDIEKGKYFPQVSGGMQTGDFTSKHKGEQELNLTVLQMIYDFGKVKSNVNTEKALLSVEQAKVLVSVDSISYQVVTNIINIIKYKELIRISKQQISGIQDILNIANMRAKAGISSQADPIQAQSFLQSAQSQLILNESYLMQYELRLSNLLGFSSENTAWKIPENFVKLSGLYEDLDFKSMPKILIAKAELEAAKEQKKGVELSYYPTITLKARASQLLNRADASSNQNNNFDSSIMLEATSNFYQGGTVSAKNRAASFVEQIAKAKIQSIYLELDVALRNARSEVDNKQRQMEVLLARQRTSIKKRELYQEQYKLGTRSILDLLNTEMSIHTSSTDLDIARYDIYQIIANFIQLSGKSRHIYQLNNTLIQGFEVKL